MSGARFWSQQLSGQLRVWEPLASPAYGRVYLKFPSKTQQAKLPWPSVQIYTIKGPTCLERGFGVVENQVDSIKRVNHVIILAPCGVVFSEDAICLF